MNKRLQRCFREKRKETVGFQISVLFASATLPANSNCHILYLWKNFGFF